MAFIFLIWLCFPQKIDEPVMRWDLGYCQLPNEGLYE